MEKALELDRKLRELGMTPFDGAAIDFHRSKPMVIFFPETRKLMVATNDEELLKALEENEVRRVLFDALWPSKIGVLLKLAESGTDVFVLSRPNALSGFKAMVRRRYGLSIGKDDYVDAVALAYTWPKFHRRYDVGFFRCWPMMLMWRNLEQSYRKQLQLLSNFPPELRKGMRTEIDVEGAAREFVAVVEANFPEIQQLFEEFGIADDIIACAYCSEVFLEVDENRSLRKNLNKAGIRSGPRVKGAKKFIHDGAMSHATTQLAIKMYGRPPFTEEDEMQIARLKRQIITTVWQFKRRALSRAAWSGEARVRPLCLHTLAPRGAEAY